MANNILSLGELSGPLLIFGGPYSNLQALQAIRQQAELLAIAPENCICTGDVVAYCGQPKETIAAIREWGIHCLMGNCEESFANNAEDCGCGFAEGTGCDLLSAQWFQFANQQLQSNERQWCASLPHQINFSIHGVSATVVHGSLSSINQFIFSSTNESIFHSELALTDTQWIIGGHCGIPFSKKIDQRLWYNAGAIGMPANDGKQHTWFCVIDTDSAQKNIFIKTQQLQYDYRQAYKAMKNAGMNNAYANALLSGLWPSMDVLPSHEKQQQGIAITEQVLSWPIK